MGQPFSIRINGISNGQQVQDSVPIEGGYNFSRAVDPDVSANITTTVPLSTGYITPITYAQDTSFDALSPDSPLLDIIIPTRESVPNVYALDRDGNIFRSTISPSTLQFGTWSNPASFTVSANEFAGGAVYYNDFLYLLGNQASNNVGRYGPLSGSASVNNTYWTSTLGLTALADPRLPQIDGEAQMEYPNHWGYVHVDNALYFADVVSDQGVVHKIQTDSSGTDTGSAYNVLDLPEGYRITCFTSWGNDLVIGAMRWNDVTGSAPFANIPQPALFFWDTISDSFYNVVEIEEWSVLTALINKGGAVYAFGGSAREGHAIGVYDGSQAVQQLAYLPYGPSPFAGAVAINGDRISWGSREQNTDNTAVVYSLGSKDPRISTTSIQCTAKASLFNNEMSITALVYPFPNLGVNPEVVLGSYTSDTNAGNQAAIERRDDDGTQDSIMDFGLFEIGEPFRIDKIRIPLADEVASGVTITPSLLIDDRHDTYTLPVINNTNYASERNIVYKRPELSDLSSGEQAGGQHDFLLRFSFGGTVPTSIKFPITIQGTTIDD